MSTDKPVRLLIADDDPNLLAAYVLFFEACGYENSSNRGRTGSPHPIRRGILRQLFSISRCPVWTGRAVAREIRKLKARIVPLLLAVSALSGPSELAESIQSGFDHHFVKPAQLPVMLAAIASRTRARSSNPFK